MISKFFINRPIFATVLALLMVLAGVVALESLPVAQFPDITPPTVQVSASISRGKCRNRCPYGRCSDRGTSQRSGRHDLYEFFIFQFGTIYIDGNIRGRHGCRYGYCFGSESGKYSARKSS